jgi:S1-C subfamily serine protease
LQLGAPLISTFGPSAELGVVLDARDNRLQIVNLGAGASGAGAGFQVGDQILAVNQSWVSSPRTLQEQLAAALSRSGQAWVYVSRNGSPQWVNLDLSGRTRGTLGVQLLEAGGNVRVARVFPGSVALKAGVQPGDQILSANGATVRTSAELMNLIRTAAAGNGELNLVIRRDGYEQTLQAKITTNDAIAAAAILQSGAVTQATSTGGLTVEQSAQLRARAASLRAALDKLQSSGSEISAESSAELQATARDVLQLLDAMDARR